VISIVVADAATFSESRLPGRAKAVQEADLAFEVSGRLIERPVDVGDQVEEGQILARIDPRDFEARLVSARGAFRTAKAQFDRAEALLAEDAIAKSVRDERRALMDVTLGRLRQAEKAVADTEITAPFSGKVTATYIENFQNVLPKQRVLRIVDSSRIEVEVSIPEDLISLLPIAYDITVEFTTYPGRKLPATLTEIGDEATRATRTYPATVVVDPPEDMDIKPGMVAIVEGRADLAAISPDRGFDVPLSALYSKPDDPEKRTRVWIVDEANSTVSLRDVEIAGLTRWGARIRGVEAGERIVTVGVHHLRDGQLVSLAK